MSRLELIADVFTDVGCGSRSGIRPAEVGGDSIRPVSSACLAKRSHWRDSSSYSRLVPKTVRRIGVLLALLRVCAVPL
jgi:hypothetical protein